MPHVAELASPAHELDLEQALELTLPFDLALAPSPALVPDPAPELAFDLELSFPGQFHFSSRLAGGAPALAAALVAVAYRLRFVAL